MAKVKAHKGNAKRSAKPYPMVCDYGDHVLNFDADMPVSAFPNRWGTFKNAGGELVATSYFESEYAERGKLFISWNKGTARFLMPSTVPGFSAVLQEMRTAKEVIINPFKVNQRTFLWLIFEDHTRNPYCLWMSGEQMDRNIPTKQDFKFKFSLHTDDGKDFEVPGKFSQNIQGRFRMDIFNVKDAIAHAPDRLEAQQALRSEEKENLFLRFQKKYPHEFKQHITDIHQFFFTPETGDALFSIIGELQKPGAGPTYFPYLYLPFDQLWIQDIPTFLGAFLVVNHASTIRVIYLYQKNGLIETTPEFEIVFNRDDPSDWCKLNFTRKLSKFEEEVAWTSAFLVMGAIVAINQKTYVAAPPKLKKTYSLPTKIREYIVSDVNLRIPRTVTVQDATLPTSSTGSREKSTRPQYDVMGFWAMNRRNSFECGGHQWEFEQTSTRRMRCTQCHTLSWYVRPHSRGDATKGTMAKSRIVRGANLREKNSDVTLSA